MSTPLAYRDTSNERAAPVYLRDGEDIKDMESSQEGMKTLTRLTALGSHAGTLQNYSKEGHTILLPSPSDDCNDPLNWSRAYKWYITFIVVLAAFACNLINAGPSIAILLTSADYHTTPSTTAYLYSTCALAQGLSAFLYGPLIAKYGKRPIYVLTFIVYTATTFGAGACKTFNAQLAVRIIAGMAAGAGEILGPTVISDIWFVHERGLPLGVFSSFLSVGVALGIFLSGYITQYLGWRYIYWIFGSMIGASTIVIFFTFPETTYQRPALAQVYEGQRGHIDQSTRHGFAKKLQLFSGSHTKESFIRLFIRPFIVIAYPAVLWAALVTAVTVGFLIAVTTNVAIAYGEAYYFGPAKVGLCFWSAIIGSLIAIAFGGTVVDKWSAKMAKGNGGLREPEMRLPAIAPVLITAPLALVLFGVGIQHHLHWIVPTIGLGLINFSIVAGTNVAIVYAIDCYKPIANEVVIAIFAYKAVVGFIFSFYTNPWIEGQGYQNAYGEMGGISAAVIVLVFPLYFFGKRIRQSSLNWNATKIIRWNQDRDDMVYEE